MKCVKCGSENNAQAVFCRNCGSKIGQIQSNLYGNQQSTNSVAVNRNPYISPQQVSGTGYTNINQPRSPQQVSGTGYTNINQPRSPQQVSGAGYTNINQPRSPQQVTGTGHTGNGNIGMNSALNQQYYAGKKSHVGIYVLISSIVTAAIIFGIVLLIRFKSDNSGKEKTSTESVVSTTDIVSTEQVTQTEDSSRTFMIYIIGSNLESESGLASGDIDEILSSDFGDDTNVIIQTGGSTNWTNSSIADGQVQRFQVVNGQLEELENLGVISMVDQNNLVDFITYASTSFPADSYSLVMWDHGGGVPIGFGMDELDPSDTLYDYELGEALTESGVHFESLIFDACNMCSLEIMMAVKDNVDYVVAAESYVNGIGIDYSCWLEGISEESTQDYCEKIVQGYMEDIHSQDMIGSMSVIRLENIDEVYNAYISYITSLNADLDNEGYSTYAQIRNECGMYEGTDSVDLTTLATKYENNESTALINSVTNCVVYTQSDIAYGHGITAYSPYTYPDYYNDGRESLVELDYDDTVVDFYDTFVSTMLAYSGDEYVSQYSGDWYNYDGTSATEAPQTGGEYSLGYTDMGGYYTLDMDSWDDITSIETMVVLDIGNDTLQMLGSDFLSMDTDDYGNAVVGKPSIWAVVNGYYATTMYVDYYSDDTTGEWQQLSYVYASVNGQDAYLITYYNNDYPDGVIQGYYLVDFDTSEILSDQMAFTEDDMVDLVYTYADSVTGEIFYELAGNEVYASDLEISYQDIDLTEYSMYLEYTVYDVYGNVYQTEMIPIE